jgi:hypothetical protein
VRTVRILVIAALAVSVAAIAPTAASAAPPTSPNTAFTIDGTATGGTFDFDAVYEAGAVAVSATASTLEFVGTPTANVGGTQTTLDFGNSTFGNTDPAPLAVGTYTLSSSTYLQIGTTTSTSTAYCSAASGSFTIAALTTDAGTGDVNSIAAAYSVTCAEGMSLTGVIRWNSLSSDLTTAYSAAQATPRSWDFGTQLTKSNGWAKTFTFANRGTTSIAYGAAGISPSTNAKNYAITNNTCSNHTVASGANCTLTITPRPQAINSYSVASTLTLAAPGLRTRVVQLELAGSDTPGIYVQPGPSRMQLFWGAPSGPIGTGIEKWEVLRGTTTSNLTLLHWASVRTAVDTSMATGRTYYYAIRPMYSSGALGDRSPAVSAIAWPKYSAGMYHRLSSSVRFVNGHKVVAGHPYTLKVDGAHSVPSSHVTAVALTITAKNPSAATSVTLYPTGSRQPADADLTLNRGALRSNFALVKVGTGGRITIATSHGSTPIYVDVSGYYSATGLSSVYGSGAAGHTYVRPGTILDTKAYKLGALKHGWEVNAPVNFSSYDTPHITSLAVEITAYDSKGSGTIAAYPSNANLPGTAALAYSANTISTTYAIVKAGQFDGYPSIALYNRGTQPVQLIMTIVGFYDDATFTYGERYTPTAPIHLSAKNPLKAGSLRTLSAGYVHANIWTTGLNLHMSASSPTKTTQLQLWPRLSGISAPAHGQLRAPAHQSTLVSADVPLGASNQFYLRNTAGTTTASVWTFGRFDAYKVSTARNYAGGGTTTPRDVAPGPATVHARAVVRRPIG